MSEARDRLRSIGAQKISEDTHIPIGHVEAILQERFEGLSKVQFIGFISILERDYGVDMSETREHCQEHFQEKIDENETMVDDVVLGNSKKKNMTIVYIVGAILLFLIAIFYTTQAANKKLETAIEEHNNTLKEEHKTVLADINTSLSAVKEANVSAGDHNVSSVVVETPEPKAIQHSFEISPRMKVWLGYIDVATNKKYQKTFQGNLELDPNKEWLLYFGHGFIDVEIDGKLTKFSDKDTLRLHYEDGKIEKISKREFKRLNRGNAW
jgi:hypothetical protein